MLFKPLLGDQLSGSVGGLTASHNRGGAYFRQRAIPTNPGSFRQQAVRAAMATLAGRWVSTLTQLERDAWTTYSDNVPLVNRIGEPKNVGGLPMYQRSNVPRIVAGLTIIDAAPTIYDLGDFTPPTVTASAGSQEITVDFDAADPWDDVDDSALLVFSSLQQNPSVNYFKGPYRFLDSIDGDSVTPPTDPTVLPFTFGATQGNVLFVKLNLTQADGRYSTPQRFRVVVGA